MSVKTCLVHSSFGNNCKSTCKICQDAKLALEIGTGTRPLVEVNANNKETTTNNNVESILEAHEVVPVEIDLEGDESVHEFNPQSGEINDNVWWSPMPGDTTPDISCPPLSVLYDVVMAGYISDLLRDDVIGEFEPQSGLADAGVMQPVDNARYENVAFTEQHAPYLYDTENVVDPTRTIQDTNDASLDNFFSRPIKIAEYQWDTSTNLFQDFNPWTLYFENPRVVNRTCNYNLMRCKLKVKATINGSGFHYGRAMMSYQPLAVFDDLTSNSTLYTQDLVQASQRPHIYLNPTTSQGGEITCPFFYHENWINIPEEDWDIMGIMNVRSLNLLRHANGATDKCTISIFAWAEDVELAVLTSKEAAALVAQSGMENEVDQANKNGVVSGPATALAGIAGALSGVPRIGPFAKATEMGMLTTASIAKMFGMSRPPETTNPTSYKPTAISSMALTTVPDGINKLTVDDKQELTIDPRISGVGGADSMSIKSIASRESYIGRWIWGEGTAPETQLGALRVDPCIHSGSSRGGSSGAALHLPACAVAALPFKYWTGSMKYRFQIVCSSFHKGRLKIVYDPNYQQSNEYNTNYTQIIDIADRTDFTIEVGNGQEFTLLEHCVPGVDATSDVFTVTGTPLAEESFGNGTLTMYVVNELTSPTTANQTVEINVFVSAGDDFEVFVPDDTYMKYVYAPQAGFEPQSGLVEHSADINPDGFNAEEESAPVHTQADALGPGKTDDPKLNLVFTGEKISSFRQMLKRYNLHSALTYVSLASQARIHYGRRPMFPYLRGNVSGAVDTAAGPVPYSFCNTVMLHWVTNCFSGWRGSIRWKLLPRGDYDEFSPCRLEVQRHHIGEDGYDQGETGATFFGSKSQAAESVVIQDSLGGLPEPNKPFAAGKGMALTTSNINPNMEFEMPYYSKYRFNPGKRENYTLQSLFSEGWDYRAWCRANTNFTLDAYVAAGEDFQCYLWTGCPPIWYEAAPPGPV